MIDHSVLFRVVNEWKSWNDRITGRKERVDRHLALSRLNRRRWLRHASVVDMEAATGRSDRARLPRQIGLKRAMGMILTGRHVSAQEGFELGFVNEVVPAGEALHAAERWANQICQNSPMSIRASKQAALEGLNVPLPLAMVAQREYPAVREMIASADYVEGPKAFAEKRPPRWRGK